MNKTTLADLYRRATRNVAGSALPDADTLLALARGERTADAAHVVSEVAKSALQSDLLHFARALEPVSSALSEELATTFDDGHARTVHTRLQTAPARIATGRWTLRRVAMGLAAGMIA